MANLKELLKPLYRFLSPKFQTLFLEYPVDFKPRYGFGRPPHPQLFEIINEQREAYKDYLQFCLKYKDNIQGIKPCNQEVNPKMPCWNNGFLPGLDMVTLYGMIQFYNPKTYLEIGSGNSTKVAYKSIQDFELKTNIVSIDPFPRVEIDALADQIIRQPFETIAFHEIPALEANDILFVDNSHRVLPNSDATAFFLEVLPTLKSGVIVHIHDIYLPYDYPQFMCDRFYSEQYMLAAFLMANPQKYQPILPNYFISEDAALSQVIQPMWDHPNLAGVERHGGGFWIKIN